MLASALHREISGNRHLSRWVAAQLLDSAMLRALSSLDRVATMLHLRAGLSVSKRKDGTLRLPNFSSETLRAMNATYDRQPAWEELRAIARHELYKFVKIYRDGNVHHRRFPTELHGERTLSYWGAGAPPEAGPQPEKHYLGLTAWQSVALALQTWNLLLRPAIDAGARLVSGEELAN